MGTEDVQARASVFCTEERHARVEVDLVRFAALVAKHQRLTRSRVADLRRLVIADLVVGVICVSLALVSAARGELFLGALMLATAVVPARLRVLSLRRITTLVSDVVSCDLPHARCSHVEDLIESFIHGMDGNVERSPTGGLLVSKGLGVDPDRKLK